MSKRTRRLIVYWDVKYTKSFLSDSSSKGLVSIKVANNYADNYLANNSYIGSQVAMVRQVLTDNLCKIENKHSGGVVAEWSKALGLPLGQVHL